MLTQLINWILEYPKHWAHGCKRSHCRHRCGPVCSVGGLVAGQVFLIGPASGSDWRLFPLQRAKSLLKHCLLSWHLKAPLWEKTAIPGSLMKISEISRQFCLVTVNCVSAKMEEVEKTAGPQCCCPSVYFLLSNFWVCLTDFKHTWAAAHRGYRGSLRTTVNTWHVYRSAEAIKTNVQIREYCKTVDIHHFIIGVLKYIQIRTEKLTCLLTVPMFDLAHLGTLSLHNCVLSSCVCIKVNDMNLIRFITMSSSRWPDYGKGKTQFAAERLDMENQAEFVYRELFAKAFEFTLALQISPNIHFYHLHRLLSTNGCRW